MAAEESRQPGGLDLNILYKWLHSGRNGFDIRLSPLRRLEGPSHHHRGRGSRPAGPVHVYIIIVQITLFAHVEYTSNVEQTSHLIHFSNHYIQPPLFTYDQEISIVPGD